MNTVARRNMATGALLKNREYLELEAELLALNAGFEAARAGNFSAEFAATVDEVRDAVSRRGKDPWLR